MNSAITDKIWGMQTRSFGTIWLTAEEADAAQMAYKNGAEYLELDDLVVARGDIAGFATGERLQNVERKRRGEWECKFGYWHERNNQCAHHLVSK